MLLTANEVAKMIDLSCVRTTSSQTDIEEMVETARKYEFGQVSVIAVLHSLYQTAAEKCFPISMWLGM